jgi:hypothetical protein
MNEPAYYRSGPALSPAEAQSILESLAEFGVPPESGTEHFSSGFEPLLAALEDRYVSGLLRDGKSGLKVVEARYGGGKTHFLYAFAEMARRSGFAVSLVEQKPREASWERPLGIYRAVAGAVKGTASDGQGIHRLLAGRLEVHRRAEGDRDVEDWIRTTVGTMPLDSASFRAAVHGYLKALLEGESASAELLGTYLLGEPVPAAALRPFGVYERMSNGNAYRMLRCLCHTVREVGWCGLVVLLDEVDRLLSSRRMTRAAEALVDNLRDLVDLVGRHELPGAMFMLAVPGREFWDLVDRYQALAERLRSPYPFGPQTPLSPVIRLDRLSLSEEELLDTVGAKLCAVHEVATGKPAQPVLRESISKLASLCLEQRTERGNRRLFVRSAALLLTGAAGPPVTARSRDELYDLMSRTAAGSSGN